MRHAVAPPKSKTILCGNECAIRCLGEPEPYELGPFKKPFLMVECDPVEQPEDICDVMGVFFLANRRR